MTNTRDAEHFEGIAGGLVGFGEKRKDAASERSKADEVHLIVVEDAHERLGRATAEKIEINLRDELGDDVGSAIAAKDVALEFAEADGADAQAPEVARGVEEVEVGAGGGRGERASHAIAGLDQRPVERFAVKGDQDGALSHAFLKGEEDGVLVGVIAHEELLDLQAAGIPPSEADEKRIRAGAAREAGGFGVEEEPGGGVGGVFGGVGGEEAQGGVGGVAGGGFEEEFLDDEVFAAGVALGEGAELLAEEFDGGIGFVYVGAAGAGVEVCFRRGGVVAAARGFEGGDAAEPVEIHGRHAVVIFVSCI